MKFDKVFILAVLLASGSAQSASLEDVQGEAWVGREKGFSFVQGSAELSPGDRVKIGRKSLARIVYPDGCKVNLRANSLMTVAKHSPCSFSAQAGGFNQGNPLGSQWGIEPLVFGGASLAALGGGIAGAVTSSNQGSTNNRFLPISGPASP
jgi:hypothetical protein